MAAVEKFNLVLQSSHNLTPTVKHFVFVREDGKVLDFIPGQFVTLMLPSTDGIKRRSYSIASLPNAQTIEVAISYVKGGYASELLFNLQLGQSVPAMGPVGKLILQNEPVKRIVLVGTGTGIAPYRAMLPTLLARPDLHVLILQGVQYRTDLLYGDDFLTFAKTHPHAQFYAHYSREDLSVNPQPHERKGYVQEHFAELSLNSETDVVYLCGNPNMIDASFEWLEGQGIPSKNIRREKYISSN
jgi:ferredoxin-NADP reductase